jgi:ABC-type uncharacterized transport system auxiliary subunit
MRDTRSILAKMRASVEMELRRLGRCLVIFGSAALALSLASCGGEHKPIKYYELSYPPSVPTAPDAFNVSIVVNAFETSHLYLDDRIVYGFDSPELGTYEYQRWAETPVEMLQTAIVRGLRSSGHFRAVYTMHAHGNPQYVLTGHLYDFKEVEGNQLMARLNFEVHLRDRKSSTTVWSHMYSHDEPVSEKTVVAFVSAMDKNLQRSMQEVRADLEEYFRAHPPQ